MDSWVFRNAFSTFELGEGDGGWLLETRVLDAIANIYKSLFVEQPWIGEFQAIEEIEETPESCVGTMDLYNNFVLESWTFTK